MLVSVPVRRGLSPDLTRRFRTGRPCLDFCHTGGDGDAATWELMHIQADVAWLAGLVLDAEVATGSAADLGSARVLRRAIWTCAQASMAGATLPPLAVAELNATASAPSLVPQLAVDGGRSWEVPATTSQALSTLARDAVDLFSGPLAGRIRVCAGADCGLLFVDASRPGQRRWCSMERCGNRVKVRAHRARQA